MIAADGRSRRRWRVAAVGVERHSHRGPGRPEAEDSAGVLLDRAGVPELHREIRTGGASRRPSGLNATLQTPPGVPRQGGDRLAGGHIPELHGPVVAGGGERSAVGAERHVPHRGRCGRATCGPRPPRPCPRPGCVPSSQPAASHRPSGLNATSSNPGGIADGVGSGRREQLPVRRRSQTWTAPAVFQPPVEQASHRPFGSEGDARDGEPEIAESAGRLSRGDIPDPDGSILTGGGQPPAVGD